jgi:putative endonuclease
VPLPLSAAWWVYVLVSRASGATYVGIALDVEQRLRRHNGLEPGGARSTRAHRPWACARVHGPFADRGSAQRTEARIKRARGAQRLTLA